MKKTGSIFTALLLLLVSACSTPTKAAGLTAADIFTQVAITLTAQAGSASPTATPQLTPSSTVTATELPMSLPTVGASPTQIVSAPTQIATNVVSPSTGSGCNNSLYVSDVTIPDGTVMALGQAFVKTWQFQNSGSCSWSSDYQLIFTSGKAMNGSTTAIAQTVSSGSDANVSVSLVAPSSEGTYTGYWQLADANGNIFGAAVYVQIKVSKNAATITPTTTSTEDAGNQTDTPAPDEATATSTRTRTPTRGPSATATPKPSKTALPDSTFTSTPSLK
jgi:hypothetical protein